MRADRHRRRRISGAHATTDPRAFLIHKLWLSAQEDRDPIKKQSDCNQASAVWTLLKQLLPQYRLDAGELPMFPRELAENLLVHQKDPSLPPDFK
jgi:hypothetical protein